MVFGRKVSQGFSFYKDSQITSTFSIVTGIIDKLRNTHMVRRSCWIYDKMVRE